MFSSDRGIIAALAGCIILAAVGLRVSSLNYPEEQGYQSYRYAADKPYEIASNGGAEAQAVEYRKPCQKPKGRDESELCAQWRAAKAAENSAFWAEWGLWVTLIGAFGLLVTIGQGRIALERAREANEISEDTAKKQLRAYVDICDDLTKIERRTGADKDGCLGYKITISVRNYGQTPAKNARSFVEHRFVNNPIGDVEFAKNPKIQWVPAFDIPPSGNLIIPLHASIKQEVIDKITRGEISLFVTAFVAYEDIFGQSRQTQFAMQTSDKHFLDSEFAVLPNMFSAT